MADGKPQPNRIERGLEWLVLASRWLQAPLYVGLIVVLAVVVAKFPFKIWELIQKALNADETDVILLVLSLIDLILVANLVVMVIISGYENFVNRIEHESSGERLSWFGKLDSGSLKLKLATSIVAISSVHLLQRFLDATEIDNNKLYALVVLQMTFVVSALLIAIMDRVGKDAGSGH